MRWLAIFRGNGGQSYVDNRCAATALRHLCAGFMCEVHHARKPALRYRARTCVPGIAMSSHPAKPPCPYCGAPLPTVRSKQCLKCHYDWHDPDNVVRHGDERWNRFGLDWDKQYVVALCQEPDGTRYTRYREVGAAADPRAVFETTPASGKQFVDWGYYVYAEHLALTDGTRFCFEAHGIWLTVAEMQYLFYGKASDPAPWVNGIAPRLPPC